MTNHEVWVVVAWGLYAGTILRGAYRASGINHTLLLNVTAISHILILFLIGTALVDSTGQFPGFFSAFLTGVFAFLVVGVLFLMLRRKFEWNEALAAVRARASLSAGLAAQVNVHAEHRAIGEGAHADNTLTNLPAPSSSSG
jgi:hypothetical protein